MPLSGLKVLELANILAGPLVGQFCAELGADVVKVEQPGSGDPTRGWRLRDEDAEDDRSAYFCAANWGKRSIALDLATDEGRRGVHALVRRSDVVIMGFKPGDESKLAVDYETLRALRPDLVYLQLSAYGPDDDRPGFDAVIQAESGFTYLNGAPDGEATKMPVALMDLLAAHQLKEGLLLALLERQRTGKGAWITTSLLAAATASLANQASNYLVAGVVPERMGSEHPNIVPYGSSFPAADGREIVLAIGTERQFQSFVAAIGLPELAQDVRFATNAARVKYRVTLNGILRNRIGTLPSAALTDELLARKVPFGFINDMEQVFSQPASRGQLTPDGRGVRTVALSGVGARRELRPPPHLDEHGDEIRRSLRESD